jgi:hypothetical protein
MGAVHDDVVMGFERQHAHDFIGGCVHCLWVGGLIVALARDLKEKQGCANMSMRMIS